VQQLRRLHQHIVIRRKAVSTLQKYPPRRAEVCRDLPDIRFYFLNG
jgi:hypothetical protein